MLVLSRKKNTSIKITVNGIEIDVWAIEIRGDKVRLGFDAPEEVVIHRHEVWEQIKKQHDAAAVEPKESGKQAVEPKSTTEPTTYEVATAREDH